MAIVTPIGVVKIMLSAASFNEFFNGVRNVSSCHTDWAASVKYQRNEGDWNDERLLPELNPIRMATSTGTSDHSTYSHVMVANPNACRPGRLRLMSPPTSALAR